VLGGTTVKPLVELSGQQLSIRAIARRLDVSRTPSASTYARPGCRRPSRGRPRPSRHDPFRAHVRPAPGRGRWRTASSWTLDPMTAQHPVLDLHGRRESDGRSARAAWRRWRLIHVQSQ
jgi:hypothetical protein